MAMVPHSFIRANRASAPAQAPATPAGKTPKTKAPKPKKPAKPVKKPHGFFRRALGAVAKHALRDTGHIGHSLVRAIHEMDGAGGLGGTPVNNASSGAISGLGQPGSDEPGVKRKKKTPLLTYGLFKRTRKLK